MTYLEDHGFLIVQLRERRRELLVALAGSSSISSQRISEIAAVQHAIAAIEAVIGDLDAEAVVTAPARRLSLVG